MNLKVSLHWWLSLCKKSKTLISSRDLDGQRVLHCDLMGGHFGLLIKILCITSRKNILMVKKSYNVNVCEVVLVYYLKCLFCWKLIHLLTYFHLGCTPPQSKAPSKSRHVWLWPHTPGDIQPKVTTSVDTFLKCLFHLKNLRY